MDYSKKYYNEASQRRIASNAMYLIRESVGGHMGINSCFATQELRNICDAHGIQRKELNEWLLKYEGFKLTPKYDDGCRNYVYASHAAEGGLSFGVERNARDKATNVRRAKIRAAVERRAG